MISSYGGGRQRAPSTARKAAWERGWALWGLSTAIPIDWTQVFGRSAPLRLEIGFGTGEHLLSQAQRNPDTDFIGVERYRPGIGALLAAIDKEQLKNLRVFAEDAHQVLAKAIPDNALARVDILFPDPWPKRRHHARRLIQPAFVHYLAEKLVSGGQLHCATDWAPYAAYMESVLAAEPLLVPMALAPEQRAVATKFEQRGIDLGHAIADFWYARR